MNSDHEATASSVRAMLSDVLNADQLETVDDDALLFERMLIDSLHLVAMVSALEGRFGIEVTAEDLVPDNFGSILTIARFVARKTAGG
jgi:acyl carrier protein